MTEVEEKKNIKMKDKDKKEQESKDIVEQRRITPLSTLRTFDKFFDELNRWMSDLWKPSRFWSLEPFTKAFDEEFFRTPLSNIKENEKTFEMSAELPGLDKDDLEITVHDGQLEIKGERKDEYEEKDEGYIRREYQCSSYYRTFNLPENVDDDNIDAEFDKGILKITLPKSEIEKKEKKKIEVK